MRSLGLVLLIESMILLNAVLVGAAFFALDLGPQTASVNLESGKFYQPSGGDFLQTTPPPVTPLRKRERQGRQTFTLLDDYYYCYGDTGEVIKVPKFFVTDFASIPRIARVLYDPSSFAEAATVHDYLYAVGSEGGRPKADLVFKTMLKESGVSARRAAVMYRTVRIGGNGGYGLKEDWEFRSPTGDEIEPPLKKEMAGVIDQIDCEQDFFDVYLDPDAQSTDE